MQRVGIKFVRAVLAMAAMAGLSTLLFSPPAAAAVTCDRVAAVSGSDNNAGTVSSPWQTPQYIADHLAPGQTGCFRAGTYAFDGTDVSQPGITLTSYPGERATLKGALKILQTATSVTVSNLNLDGRSPVTNIGPKIYAANTTFDNDDVTNYHSEICFVVGAANPADGRASHTVIENSRIHDCGKLPSGNQDHGIYVDHATDAVIRNNWIYNNTDRGVQLYPDSQGTQIYGNVIDGNGEGIIFGGDGETASSNNQVYNNVIADSNIGFNVQSYWPDGVVGSGNVVRDNCVWASNAAADGYYKTDGGILPRRFGADGFSAYENTVAKPQFVNAAAGNFTLQSGSPCASPGGVVTLQTKADQIRNGGAVTLAGRVTPARSVRVTIQIRRHGHWRMFGRTRLRPSGRFKLHKRLGRHLVQNLARFRAKVPRIGRSRPVVIRVRR